MLITGGAGFIGSHLVSYFLEQGWEVVVLDNCCAGNKLTPDILSKIDFFQVDIRDADAVLRASKGCAIIIHLAALVGVDEVIAQPLDTIEIEVQGSQNVGRAAIINKVQHIIYTSSSAVYKNTLQDKSRENDPLHLVNDYAVAKRINEVYLQALTKEKGITTNSLRLFNVYGKHQDTRMVIPRFFDAAWHGQAIQVFGDGQQTRDFTHVNEVAQAMDKLLQLHSLSGIFNVSRGKETSILELAQLIKKITQSKAAIQLLDFPKKRLDYKVNKRVGSPEKLLEHTGFRPIIALEEGLKLLAQELELSHSKTVAA